MTRGMMVLVLLAVTASCAGVKAREEVLLPAVRLSWSSVGKEVERGIDVDQTLSGAEKARLHDVRVLFGARLEAKEIGPAPLASDWLLLKPWGELGISDMVAKGEIGPGVASSLRERQRNFEEAVFKFDQRR